MHDFLWVDVLGYFKVAKDAQCLLHCYGGVDQGVRQACVNEFGVEVDFVEAKYEVAFRCQGAVGVRLIFLGEGIG